MSLIELPLPDPAIVGRRDAIVRDLIAIAGADIVISDEDGRRAFETDALTAYRRMPLAVVLPTSTQTVSAVLKYAKAQGIKVVPRGAGTSLCGGALPLEDAIVLGVSKMNRVLEIDYHNRFARVEAGITNLAISAAVSAEEFFYAPDPSSQIACTLAGNLAMNSGGAHCLKYGVTTNNVLGVTLVTMDGEIVEIGGGHLDAEGYDLLALVVGSEGQFGVITEATVRILRAAEGARPMMIGFDSSAKAGICVARIIASGIIPVAIEFMDKPAIEVCEAFAKAGYPTNVEALLIIEVEGSEQEIADRLAYIASIAHELNPIALVVSGSAEQSARIWKGRKSAFGAIGRISDYYCMDGTIPLGHLPHVLEQITEICGRYGLRVANIFHAGDGNLHPLVMYDANTPGETEKAERAGAEILKLCVSVGGCLTGEHGVGIEKRDLMRAQFTAEDLAVQLRIKSVFDPDWLLNCGKVFPLDTIEAAKAMAAEEAQLSADKNPAEAA
ncbi:FAD-linked oxidase C-terminal domain-containing protein [Hyphomicrobium sp.]|uniref:FAD-linked oxidase C-terminal domain-containing protein n=1 Tax=Hyphomicrobium sp. TaxID=82 RepID=UPI002E2FD8C9|nr:FAD-linked oxidase C-terminal domain-containing protein [Hyphomicrobium sp.]HEX2841664.1 FAD-linked oxidase C-terminal domain-containing protein [Hyphomicrobium sp.]